MLYAPASTPTAADIRQRCIDERWSSALRDCMFTARGPEHLGECEASNGEMNVGAARRHALADFDCQRIGNHWVFAHPDIPRVKQEASKRLWQAACNERKLPAVHAHCLLAARGDVQLRACVDRFPAGLPKTIEGRRPSSSECAQAADTMAEKSIERGPMPAEMFASNAKTSCLDSWTVLEAYCVQDLDGITNPRDCGPNVDATLEAHKRLMDRR